MKIMKQVHVFADSTPEDKIEACEALVSAVMDKIKELDVSPQVLETLVRCSVHMICTEAYTRDMVAPEAAAKIFQEWCKDFSTVLGLDIELMTYQGDGRPN